MAPTDVTWVEEEEEEDDENEGMDNRIFYYDPDNDFYYEEADYSDDMYDEEWTREDANVIFGGDDFLL